LAITDPIGILTISRFDAFKRDFAILVLASLELLTSPTTITACLRVISTNDHAPPRKMRALLPCSAMTS